MLLIHVASKCQQVNSKGKNIGNGNGMFGYRPNIRWI